MRRNFAEILKTAKIDLLQEYGRLYKLFYNMQDDYGVSYYYRGAVEDNYVTFADMCWRIVRIQGDGSVKLILEDQDQACGTSINGNWCNIWVN